MRVLNRSSLAAESLCSIMPTVSGMINCGGVHIARVVAWFESDLGWVDRMDGWIFPQHAPLSVLY